LLGIAVAVGSMCRHLLEQDVTAIVGDKGKHNPSRAAYRHTTERSSGHGRQAARSLRLRRRGAFITAGKSRSCVEPSHADTLPPRAGFS
jgi:hypothetical protein